MKIVHTTAVYYYTEEERNCIQALTQLLSPLIDMQDNFEKIQYYQLTFDPSWGIYLHQQIENHVELLKRLDGRVDVMEYGVNFRNGESLKTPILPLPQVKTAIAKLIDILTQETDQPTDEEEENED